MNIKDLIVNYNNKSASERALGPISLTAKNGEIVVLIGPSGCGKSTLLKVLAGIIKDYEGSITLEGEPLSYKKHLIGYIPQGYGLLPWKTVYQNCLLPYKIKGIPVKDEVKSNLDAILKTLEIDALKKRYPMALSGGQKQRVAIARTLAARPTLLLMDEPFSALDAIMKEEATALFLKVWEQHKCHTIMVTHSIEEALYIGNKIVILSNSPGTIQTIIENPLFGNINFREELVFKTLYHDIQEHLRKGWET